MSTTLAQSAAAKSANSTAASAALPRFRHAPVISRPHPTFASVAAAAAHRCAQLDSSEAATPAADARTHSASNASEDTMFRQRSSGEIPMHHYGGRPARASFRTPRLPSCATGGSWAWLVISLAVIVWGIRFPQPADGSETFEVPHGSGGLV